MTMQMQVGALGAVTFRQYTIRFVVRPKGLGPIGRLWSLYDVASNAPADSALGNLVVDADRTLKLVPMRSGGSPYSDQAILEALVPEDETAEGVMGDIARELDAAGFEIVGPP